MRHMTRNLQILLLISFTGAYDWLKTAATIRTITNNEASIFWEGPYSQPYFDNSSRRDVTATVGQAALLHCRVRNLGDRAVSWIRKRDLHILTIGIMTYTNDQRFQSLHSDGTEEWSLKITSPQPRDSGIYECQVSTEPKISQAFRLTVVVSKAKILGNAELYIKSGSDINLTCIAQQAPSPPSYIYWFKDGRLINYSQRGGINILTERQTKTSRLLIARAMPADSGNYTCSPSNSDPTSSLVHVIKSEHRAAMQHENSGAISLSFPTYFTHNYRNSKLISVQYFNTTTNHLIVKQLNLINASILISLGYIRYFTSTSR